MKSSFIWFRFYMCGASWLGSQAEAIQGQGENTCVIVVLFVKVPFCFLFSKPVMKLHYVQSCSLGSFPGLLLKYIKLLVQRSVSSCCGILEQHCYFVKYIYSYPTRHRLFCAARYSISQDLYHFCQILTLICGD